MNALKYELRKILFHQKGLLYVVAFLLASAVWLTVTDAPYHSAMEQHQGEYQWYLQQVAGPYTQEKADFLEAEASAIAQAKRTRGELLERYEGGEISQTEYQQSLAPLDEVLAHQNGFEVIFEQYLYICENGSNRYFLQTNGWTGLLSGGTLDVLLVLSILLLVTPVFCREYSCQMDGLIMTAKEGRKSPWHKLLIVAGLVAGLCLGVSLMRLAFYAHRYGLPNGDYPIQSIGYFSGSTKPVSLLGGYFIITALRCFGGLYLALSLLLCSVLVKKYALTMVLGMASVVIPYLGLPATTVYRLPLPLPFLLATDFLAGSIYAIDALTGAEIALFQAIGTGEFLVVLGISAALFLAAIVLILRLNTNYWQIKAIKKPPMVAIALCITAMLALSGCAPAVEPAVAGTCAGYEILWDDVTRNYSLEDSATGETLDLSRSPLFGVFSDAEIIKSYYCSEPYVYYSTSRTKQHVDRVGRYNSSVTQVSIVQLNLETFEERVIFEQVVDSGRSILGIDYETSDQWGFLQYHHGFSINKDSIFFEGSDGITEVNRKTKQIQALDVHPMESTSSHGSINR